MRGSPFWQTAFFFAGAIFLVWQTWRGWRVGLFRSGVNLAAILVSAVLGSLAAEVAAAPFGGLRYLSGFVAGLLVGGGLGLFLFFAIWFVGVAPKPGAPESPHARVAGGLMTLKKSLELGSAGRLLQSVDVLPPGFYELVMQIGTLTSDQERMLRFFDYPGIQEVLQNPRVVDLITDPGLIRAWRDRNVLMILDNKTLAAAVKDPLLAEQLRKVELPAALKFALESPSPSQSPSPSPSPKKER